jgi:hypothetical protein
MPQPGRLLRGQAGQHPLLQRAHPVPVAPQQGVAVLGQGQHQPAPVGGIAVPLDQSPSLQRRDHVRHGLRGHERVARELGRGQVRMTFEHRQRRVL